MRIFVIALKQKTLNYERQPFDDMSVLLKEKIISRNINNVEVYNIRGTGNSGDHSPENLLSSDMQYKNSQTATMIRNFVDGYVSEGDRILFTDAWHPGILQIKFVSESMQIPVEIHTLWHTGSYDMDSPFSRTVKDKRWSGSTERALYYASNINYFATTYHVNVLRESLLGFENKTKDTRTGFPLTQLKENLEQFDTSNKKRQIVCLDSGFNNEQHNILSDIRTTLADIDFIWLNKHDENVHKTIAESLACFSANIHGTFDIDSCIKAPLLGCLPLVPLRLSYVELSAGYNDFTYDSEFTKDWNSYEKNKEKLISRIYQQIDNYENLQPLLQNYCEYKLPIYTQCNTIVDNLLKQD